MRRGWRDGERLQEQGKRRGQGEVRLEAAGWPQPILWAVRGPDGGRLALLRDLRQAGKLSPPQWGKDINFHLPPGKREDR